MTDTLAITAANRAAWDASAPLHGAGAEWERLTAGFTKPGFSTLDPTLTETLTALHPANRRAVQIGCNNGRELLSLASLGAVPALGIDQSAGFLEQAETLAQIAGFSPQFLCANIYDLPPDTPTDHDLGLITIGVLNWMPDLPGFFAAVAGLLKPGAPLVIYETHPFLEMFEPGGDTPHTPTLSYFSTEPHIDTDAITYDGSDGGEVAASYWFSHTLGQIVTDCINAGFTLDRLTEHPHSNREVEYDQYENRTAQIPMSFTLVAHRT